MSRARLIPPEFWTSEAVVDCPPMTRLLLLGLANFADDFGVLPLRPRTVRLQVFPGDALDDDQVRAMLDELVARGLLCRYAVDGVEYLAIVDWMIHQRVGRHARRRYPADPSVVVPSPREGGEKVPSDSEADEGLSASAPTSNDSKPSQSPSSALRAPSPRLRGEKEFADAAPPPDAASGPGGGGDDLSGDGRDCVGEMAPMIDGAACDPSDPRQPLRPEAMDAALSPTPRPVMPASTPRELAPTM